MMQAAESLSFIWINRNLGRFMPIFAGGVTITTRDGIALDELLCKQLGFKPSYVDGRVQTIFVNSRAVDQLDQVHLTDGAVIALSAAMPGLAGATLRRGSRLASMRWESAILHDTPDDGGRKEISVRLKLFNTVARDMASVLLAQGVWVDGKVLASMIKGLPVKEMNLMKNIRLNNKAATIEQLIRHRWPDSWVNLRVSFDRG